YQSMYGQFRRTYPNEFQKMVGAIRPQQFTGNSTPVLPVLKFIRRAGILPRVGGLLRPLAKLAFARPTKAMGIPDGSDFGAPARCSYVRRGSCSSLTLRRPRFTFHRPGLAQR